MTFINEIHSKFHIEFDLQNLGCPEKVAVQIANGTTFSPLNPHIDHPFVYVAGRMRGIKNNNFDAFDTAKGIALSKGYNVISPADIDRYAEKLAPSDQASYFIRDVWSLYFLAKVGKGNGILLLPDWYRSVGAAAEFLNSRWIGLRLFKALRNEMEPTTTEALLREFSMYWISVRSEQ
jgi:uncharacterized protein DUF4406